MTVGLRIQRLRLAHGHTLKDAEELTGVTRATLCRLENGARPPRFDGLVLQIARGYGIDPQQLLRDPVGDFAWAVLQMDPMHRLHLLRAGMARRTYVALRFLLNHCAGDVPLDELAAEAGLSRKRLSSLVASWHYNQPPQDMVERLAKALIKCIRLSPQWFRQGYLPDEAFERQQRRAETLARQPLLRRAR